MLAGEHRGIHFPVTRLVQPPDQTFKEGLFGECTSGVDVNPTTEKEVLKGGSQRSLERARGPPATPEELREGGRIHQSKDDRSLEPVVRRLNIRVVESLMKRAEKSTAVLERRGGETKLKGVAVKASPTARDGWVSNGLSR